MSVRLCAIFSGLGGKILFPSHTAFLFKKKKCNYVRVCDKNVNSQQC